MYEFRWPTRTVVGAGLLGQIGELLPPPSDQARLLLVAPQEAWVRPLLDSISSQLRQVGWAEVVSFAQVEPNPSWKTVARGEEVGCQAGADAVLALGGGSAMDAGKVIAERCGVGLLCTVPTTAGTGSEISPWAVITNTEAREKDSVVAQWPDLALLDPELSVTLPSRTTLFTGIDAFIHGLEAYLSSAATPITDALALAGCELTASSLCAAVEGGSDIAARRAMLEGSLLTGAAMLHAGLGLMHAIGNVTGGLYHDLPHGLILLHCMDPVLAYNRPALGKKFEAIQPLVDRLGADAQRLLQRFRVEPISVAAADLPLLVERALENVNARTNPRPGTPEGVEAVVRQAFVVR